MSSQPQTTLEQLAISAGMDSLIHTTMNQKNKERQIIKTLQETYLKSFEDVTSPPRPQFPTQQPTYAPPQPTYTPAQPTYAQVAQPRARRSASVKTVTNWPEVSEDDKFVKGPYMHPYDRAIPEHPVLPPAASPIRRSSPIERTSPIRRTLTAPARYDTPFGSRMPDVLNVTTFQDEVRKRPEQVFNAMTELVADLELARDQNETLKRQNEGLLVENERLKEDKSYLKDNWQDVRVQARDIQRQLIKTQVEMANKHRNLAIAQQELREEKENSAQRRLDWINRAEAYEQLVNLKSAKEVLLWKFIERIQKETVSEDGESDVDYAVGPMTGVKKAIVPILFESLKLAKSSSCETVKEYRGSPGKTSKSSAEYRVGSPEKTFNPAANWFVPGALSPTKSVISSVSVPELPPVDILSCVLSLPPRFYGVCPNSLCSSTEFRCKVPSCRLQQVCESYNDERGEGCHQKACMFLHEYRSCHEEIDGWGCRFKAVHFSSKARQAHLKVRIHEHMTTPEEWRARVIIAGLRIAHQEGKY